ncbi:MAG: hypothetical protein KBC88_07545 [Alphaproteobacteria bacterium]|jgi:hypothetical protein|nr:hypothetical protein [Alphaproteobacteria bacterium]MBP9868764.1 hypothetical protein [Alphaproteobacteria bacterium]
MGNVRGWEDTVFEGKDMGGRYSRSGAEAAAANMVALDNRTRGQGAGAIDPSERAQWQALQQAKSEFQKEPPEVKSQGFQKWVVGEMKEEAADRGQSIGATFQGAARGDPAAASPAAPAMQGPAVARPEVSNYAAQRFGLSQQSP